MAKRIFLILLVVGWLVVIFNFSDTISSISGDQTMKAFEIVITYGLKILRKVGIISKVYSQDQITSFATTNHLVFRKFCHMVVYMILGVFMSATVKNVTKLKLSRVFAATFLLCFIFSMIDEYHQLHVAGRTGLFTDCLIDAAGSTIGFFVYYFLHRIKESIKQKLKKQKLLKAQLQE